MRINPIIKKELKLSARTPKLMILVVIFNTVLMAIGLGITFFIKESSLWMGHIYFRYNIYTYIIITFIEYLLLFFIVPTITAGSISGEREKQTLDLLLTSGLRPINIITGKLLSAFANIMLVIISALPVIGITFIYGGISFRDIVITILSLFFSMIYIGSIGIFCSSVLKRTTFSTLLAYGIEFVLIFGVYLAIGLIAIIRYVNSGYMTHNIGVISLLLLVSPLVSFAYIISNQVASLANINTWFLKIGMPKFIVEHYSIFSFIIQCIFICIFISLAVYYLKDRTKQRR